MSQVNHESQAMLQEASDKQFDSFIELVKNNQVESVRQFLKQYNGNVLSRLQLGFRQPALYFAITTSTDQNSLQMMKVLVGFGANIKYKDQNDQTIMFYACRDGKVACCKFLIQQHGLDIDEQDMYGQTPLFYAASENRLNLLDLFTNRDEINHVDKLASQTALYYAARKGHTEFCRRLIEKGANPAHLDSQNKNAADYAKKARHNETAELINQQIRRQKDILMPQSIQMSAQRDQSQQTNQRKKKETISVAPFVTRATYKIVFMNDKGQARDLTQEQVRNMVKNNPTLENYLTNPNSIPTEELEKMERTESWQKLASKCLQTLMKQKGAFWFLEPVDPVKFNIMDYVDIIEKPMDFGTIKKKLGHNVYRSLQHFIDDMNLVWNNCCKYNGEHHEISKTAREIENFFNEELKKVGLDQWRQ